MIFLLALTVAIGQTTTKAPEFEVASIRLSDPNTPLFQLRTPNLNAAPGRNLNFANIALRELIALAYGVGPGQISGPEWLTAVGREARGQNRFDIVARVPADSSKEQIPVMLQLLLSQRFKLDLHRDRKVMQAYALEVANGGPTLHESERQGDPGCTRSLAPRPGVTLGITCHSLSAADLAREIQIHAVGWVEGPVVDKTGISGVYDFDLGWITRPEADAGSDGPTFFDALERQFRLKLEARKESVEILVVDHCEKVPTEN
jgi:uncharacterized protein (TIGR03435 family)